MLQEYHKIDGLFARDEVSKELIYGKYRNEEIEFTKDLEWEFTEKVDGTNIRIYWDGHRVSYNGRTDRAQIPAHLMNRLIDLFGGESNEELFEQKFGETEVELVGEGYGIKIQNGGLYRDDVDFILFDVKIGGNWQPRTSVEDIAKYFGIDVVPIVMRGTIEDGIEFIKERPKSLLGKQEAPMEGLVGRLKVELCSRTGKRLIVKIKVRDFK